MNREKKKKKKNMIPATTKCIVHSKYSSLVPKKTTTMWILFTFLNTFN